MPKLWLCLESIAGGMAPAMTWRALLSDEWQVVRTAFMGRRPDRAVSLPCPRGGDGHAVVVHAEDDIVAVSDGESCTCDDQSVTADQVAMWAVSPTKLGRALAKALDCQPRDCDEVHEGVFEVGAFSGHGVPVFLILSRDGAAFRAAVSELVARQEAFGLIAPTTRYVDALCRDLLGRRRTVVVDLETNIEITKAGILQVKAGVVAGELLKGLLPKDGERKTENGRQETDPQPRYLLRKGHGVWKVLFDGVEAEIKDGRGITLVAHLLFNPFGEGIHATELGAVVFGNAVVEAANLVAEGDSTRRMIEQEARELLAALKDQTTSDTERAETFERLEELGKALKVVGSNSDKNTDNQVRATRRAIERLIERLQTARHRNKNPHKTLQVFGRHLHTHLWIPSSRYSGKRSGRTRTKTAGRFVYEPPEGVTWVE